MNKKTLFKANIIYTKEKMLEYLKSKSTFDETYLRYLIICVCGCTLLVMWELFLGTLFLFISILYTLIRYYKKPKVEAQNFINTVDEQFHTTEINQEISFTNNSIKIKNLTSWANCEMFYNQIIRLIDKKDFYGLIFKYSYIFIDKNCFTKWNELEFKEFINQKIDENIKNWKLNMKTNIKLDRAFKASIVFLIIFVGLTIYSCFLPEDTNNESTQNYASIDQIYQTLSDDDSKIAEWYSIPIEFLGKYPDIVSLILNSMSLEDSEDKQNWFDMFYIMNDEQINELRDILTREKEKLEEIEEKYNEEVSEIDADNNQENNWGVL